MKTVQHHDLFQFAFFLLHVLLEFLYFYSSSFAIIESVFALSTSNSMSVMWKNCVIILKYWCNGNGKNFLSIFRVLELELTHICIRI